MCFKALAKSTLAAGYGAPGMSVNTKLCKEIYNRLQAPGIKNNAKLRSACRRQTCDLSSFLASLDFPFRIPSTPCPSFCASVFALNIAVSFIYELN